MSADICPKCDEQSVRGDECNYCGWSAFRESDLWELRNEIEALQSKLDEADSEENKLLKSLDAAYQREEKLVEECKRLTREFMKICEAKSQLTIAVEALEKMANEPETPGIWNSRMQGFFVLTAREALSKIKSVNDRETGEKG